MMVSLITNQSTNMRGDCGHKSRKRQVLNKQCMNRHISIMESIKEQVDAGKTHRDDENSKISQQFTTKDARIKLKRLYSSIPY